MKSSILRELRAAAEEWARNHNVQTILIDVKYSGVGSYVHVIIVANKGFENWRWSERDRSLFDFLHTRVSNNGDFFISRLETMTEAEYEKYEGIEV